MKLGMALRSKRTFAKKLSVRSTRKEGKRGGAWNSTVCVLIQLVMLYQVWGRVTKCDELINIQKKKFTFMDKEEEKRLVINPDGTLNPLHGKLTDSIRVMHNKRFLAPEIKIEYSIRVKKPFDVKYIYSYTRNCRLDRVRNDSDLRYKGELLKYKRAYFNALLEMFPSLYGYLSIFTDRKDSFYGFINGAAVKEHKHKILASLFLLAEGVDVPLDLSESQNGIELVLRKEDDGGEHFRVSMNVVVKTNKESAEYPYVYETMPERGAVSVVKFFIENRNNPVLKEEGYNSEPKKYGDFLKGKFENSPVFLIQTFVYHYMEDEKETVSFIEAVYNLLCEYMVQEGASKEGAFRQVKSHLNCAYVELKDHVLENIPMSQARKELAKEAKRVFKRHFVSSEQISAGVKCIKMVEDYIRRYLNINILHHPRNFLRLETADDVVPIEKNMNRQEQLLSFNSRSGSVSIQKEEDFACGGFADPSEGFTDYGETVLLGLFCRALYNFEESIYTVDHIESASEELKSFFRKHKYMYGSVSKEVHDEWNQVVGGISDPNIQYLRPDRNQLVPGWINMLYVIKEITGVGDTEKLDGFRERVKCIDSCHRVNRVRGIFERPNCKTPMDQLHELEKKAGGTIHDRELNKKKVFEDMLELASEEEAAKIRSEIEKMTNMMEERKDMDTPNWPKSYSESNRTLKDALKNDISSYMSQLIKKIALSTNASIKYVNCCKGGLKTGYIDIFGEMRIAYTPNKEEDEIEHLAHPCWCEFKVYIHCWSKDTRKEQWTASFNMHTYGDQFDKTNIFPVRTESFFTKMPFSYINQISYLQDGQTDYTKFLKWNLLLYKNLFYEGEFKNVDTLLINPLMNIPQYKIGNIWILLQCIKKQNLGSKASLVHLLNNMMGSATFMHSDDQDEMFTLLRFILEKDYYPSVSIDNDACKKPICFTYAIKKVLDMVKDFNGSSPKFYADAITDLMINFRRTCLEVDYYQELERFVKEILYDDSYRVTFIESLTEKGNSINNITKIVQAMREIEKAHPVEGYEKYSNEFLKWIIWKASISRALKWPFIIKKSYNLIDEPKAEKDDFTCLSPKWADSVDLGFLSTLIGPVLSVPAIALSVWGFS
ncbi:hypothetical protein NEAUS03_0816 [Nematocida ausubeli]|nr:hypothetical protein NEAUS03_0816 [Nematocida ausubeli]